MNEKYRQIAEAHVTPKGNSLNNRVLYSLIFLIAYTAVVIYGFTFEPQSDSWAEAQVGLGFSIIFPVVFYFTAREGRAANALRSRWYKPGRHTDSKKYFGPSSIVSTMFGNSIRVHKGSFDFQKDGYELYAALGYLINLGYLSNPKHFKDNRNNTRVGLFSVNLVAVSMRTKNILPHVYIDSRKNNSIRLNAKGGFVVSRILKGVEQINLEGNLDTHLRFFTNEQNAINALAVFGPDVMLGLQEHLQEFDLEVSGNVVTLISFKKHSRLTEADVGRQIAAAEYVKDVFIPLFEQHLHQNNTSSVSTDLFVGGATAVISYLVYVTVKWLLLLFGFAFFIALLFG